MVEDGRGWRPRRPEKTPLHRAVREGWPEVDAEASERAGLPMRIRAEVGRYLGCGDVRRGFAQVRCAECRQTLLVAFSCKQRGLCPSCGARRSHQTAALCGEVLPEVPWRQWTLSVPRRLRWTLVKQPALLRRVERRLLLAVWRWQRERARRLGAQGELSGGAVGFTQYFGSALQPTPHLHVLLPDGLWDGHGGFVALPPPSAEDVGAVLRRVLRQLSRDFADLEVPWAEDELDRLWAEAAQRRLPVEDALDVRRLPRRLAVCEGFSLHADTHVGATDRQGLELLAPNSNLRSRVVRSSPPQAPPAPALPKSTARTSPTKPRPRLDWASLQRRTFEADVWACPCGGRRTVLAVVTSRATAEQVLANLGLLPPREPRPAAQSPPQLAFAL